MSTLPRVFRVTGKEQDVDTLTLEVNNVINTWNNHDSGLEAWNYAKFVNSPWSDVKSFGAIGDGTTDDATAIQAAINNVVSLGGGTVFLSAATYAIGSTIYVPSLVTIQGVSKTASVIKPLSTFSTSNSAIRFAPSQTGGYAAGAHGSHVTLRDFKLDCSQMPIGTSMGIECTNLDYALIERVYVYKSTGYGIFVSGDQGTFSLLYPKVINCILDGCGRGFGADTLGGGNTFGSQYLFNTFLNCSGTAIDNVYVDRALWMGNVCKGSVAGKNHIWSDFGMIRSTISHNFIENGSIHIYGFLGTGLQQAPSNVIVSNNYLKTASSSAILVNAANQVVTDTGQCTDIKIIGNTIDSCVDSAIVIADAPGAVIADNIINNWDTGATGSYAIVLGGGVNTSIGSTNCVIANNTGTAGASTLYYQENKAGQTNNNTLFGNKFPNCTASFDSTSPVTTFTLDTGIKLNDTESTPKTLTIKSPATLTNTWTMTLPTTAGSSNQYLTTDGSGVLSWSNAAGTGTVNSGTAGRLSLYATSTNAVSDTYVQNTKNITIAIASQGSRSANLALIVPNPGNAVTSGNLLIDSDTNSYTIASVWTLSNALTVTPTTNQLVLGTTRTVTISATQPASSSRTWTVPDISGNGTFAALEGTQTFSGSKTFSAAVAITATSAHIALSTSSNTATIQANAQATSARTFSIPDISGNGTFAFLEGTQTFSGAKTFSSNVSISADIFTTALTDYSGTSTINGWSSFTTKILQYKKVGKTVYVYFDLRGTSNSGTTNFSVANACNGSVESVSASQYLDNGSSGTTPGLISLPAGTSTVNLYKDFAGNGFTASGTKIIIGTLVYEAS